MNQPFDRLPESCDVLVAGAGPAGSACATVLARAGLDVVLVDAQAFPREKVCGDGLIPDAHRALAALGVLDAVLAEARPATHLACVSPAGHRVDVPGTLAVLPRERLDEVVCRHAVAAGARMFAPVRLAGTLEADGRVTGARLVHGDAQRDIRCRWIVLATGSVPTALQACGMLERRMPSAMSIRAYLRNPGADHPMLEFSCRPEVKGGYGWIFPMRDGVFNVGVIRLGMHDGQAGGRAHGQQTSLRESFERFMANHPSAAALLDGGTWLGPPKGAPLRCSLDGARPARPGLLVAGDAVGSTYAFTGEGIGKALETGMLAAAAIARRSDDASTCAGYAAALAALRPRFALYRRAELVTRHGWIADLLVRRAQSNARLRARLAGVLEETSNPGNLISVKGLARLVWG